jgi:hypothetical protein
VPIDIERFEDTEELGEWTASERIIRFLTTHDDQAFTRSELADVIDADPETA